MVKLAFIEWKTQIKVMYIGMFNHSLPILSFTTAKTCLLVQTAFRQTVTGFYRLLI